MGDLDDDGEDVLGGFRMPLPPDDRLWRHPSELRGENDRASFWWRLRHPWRVGDPLSDDDDGAAV